MDKYTFGVDSAAIAMGEIFEKIENKKFKKSYVRAVQNFDEHLNDLMYSKMSKHGKLYYIEAIMPNVISSFNFIRDNYRGRKGAYHMNFACGKAISHFRFKVTMLKNTISK